MKNLELCDLSIRKCYSETDNVTVVCFGHKENSQLTNVYFCTNNLVVKKIDYKNQEIWSKNLCHEVYSISQPLNITFLSLSSTLCVGLANGELLAISDSEYECQSELVGKCDNGLLALEWSPNQELLVLVSMDYKTILMSCLYDPIKENDLLSDEFGEKQFITVGWGKKETQFHGSAGKQAAKIKNEVVEDCNIGSDNIVKITWRGDGEFFAVGYSKDGSRLFKVFDREGNLQYTSEKHEGLEYNLAWKPSGNVIATSQRQKKQLNDVLCISFFEKNGLKHSDFTLKISNSSTIEDLIWSSDSEVLAVVCKESGYSKVLLYTMSNYYWYLKKVLQFNNTQQICKVSWDNVFNGNPKKLHIFFYNGQCFSYSWIWSVYHSQGTDYNDDAMVAVTDAYDVLLTGMRQSVVAPPMWAYKVTVDSHVNSINFAPPNEEISGIDTNTFFVVTNNHEIIFYEETRKFPLRYNKLKSLTLNEYKFPFQYYNWVWLNTDTLICEKVESNGKYYLVEYSISENLITQNNECELPENALSIERNPQDRNALFLQLNSGEILQYNKGGQIEQTDIGFCRPFHKFKVINVEDKLYYLGLTHNNCFYINNILCLTDASSFFIHSHFLLMTTLRHVLVCIELNAKGLHSLMEYQKIKLPNIYERQIERGAKLIIAVPNDTRTVVQLPRGNLEAVQPRSLALKIIGVHLDSLMYYEAFELMRKQRINLNLLYDHNPEMFTENIEVFLNSITNNTWLSLFLSDLENIDVTSTMYASCYLRSNTNDVRDKINKICNLIREKLMVSPDRDSKILPILTSYVKINTVEYIEKALTIIKNLKIREDAGEVLHTGSEEAVKYLLYMVDVNDLFDIALGMYDFQLVLLIANKSQKDPREYIPMLNELDKMEENYKRFSINKYLKRFDKAVQSIILCGPSKYKELKTFVQYHSLYREALAHFNKEEDIYKEICEDFGLYLRLKQNFTESGIFYERAGKVDKAIECYKEALQWEFGLKLAKKSWPEEQFKRLCWELVTMLKNEKRHQEALVILEKYLGSEKDAFKYAIESGQYKTAIRLIDEDDKSTCNLQNELLLSTVLNENSALKEQIKNNWDSFKKYRARLCTLRELKQDNPVEYQDPSYANRDGDLYSDAGSTIASSSRSSSRSFRSSKNRRKHERKIASLKEGSQYEDVALIMALHSLISSSFELRVAAGEVIIALSHCNRDKEATVLQVVLEGLLNDMERSFNEIWTPELMIDSATATLAAQQMPEGAATVQQGLASLELRMRIPPTIPNISWKLNGLKIG